MPTKAGCAPGMCQGQPDYYGANCAGINGCDEKPGYASDSAVTELAPSEDEASDPTEADSSWRRVTPIVEDEYAESRAIVAKVQAEMRAEDEANGRKLLGTLDAMQPEGRVRFMAHTVALERENAAALDYAETRLSEMRAALEALADEFTKPFGPDASKWPAGFAAPYAAAGEAIREVARG